MHNESLVNYSFLSSWHLAILWITRIDLKVARSLVAANTECYRLGFKFSLQVDLDLAKNRLVIRKRCLGVSEHYDHASISYGFQVRTQNRSRLLFWRLVVEFHRIYIQALFFYTALSLVLFLSFFLFWVIRFFVLSPRRPSWTNLWHLIRLRIFHIFSFLLFLRLFLAIHCLISRFIWVFIVSLF